MLIVDNVTYRIAGRPILEGASASIPDGHKVGLIGRNGAGKTTLLKLITKQMEPEDGAIRFSNSTRIGALAQEAPSGPESLIDIVLAADTERAELLAEEAEAKDPARAGEIHARLDAIDAYRAPARAARILSGLGFDEAAQGRPVREFSGGWRMRVALAALLFSAPDLLLLDEPTNYLDLEGALWLEDFLKRYRGTVLLVSHDRDLLNRAVDAILHLEQTKLTLYTGGYDRFVETRAAKRALEAGARVKQELARKHMQSFVDRFKAKASKARQAQSRMKMLERMTPVAITVEDRLAQIKLPQPVEASPPLLVLDDAEVGYEAGKPILTHLNLRIDSEDRIALLGSNGNGKSTLAKLMAGRLKPQLGNVVRARKLITGYFAQHQLDELDANSTPQETLSRARPLFDDTTVRSRLGSFGFSGPKADTKISSLSGGERARLTLALATLDKPNLLILDEPTNHLDIDAREELLQALNEYEGAVILISHDRRLIEGCADSLLLVANGRATPYDGDMDEYRKLVLDGINGGGKGAAKNKTVSKADQRRESAAAREKLKPLKQAITKAEGEMAIQQVEIAKFDTALAAPDLFTKDPAKATAISKSRGEALRKLAAAEARWLEATAELEEATAAAAG